MGRDFDGVTDSALNDNDPAGSYPFTMFCWGNSDVVQGNTRMALVDASGSTVYQWLLSLQDGGDEDATLITRNSTQDVVQGSPISQDVWIAHQGNYRGNSDRELFINGVTDGTGTTLITYNALTDRVCFGRLMRSSPANPFDGGLAHGSIWTSDLVVSHALALFRGANPFIMDQDDLVFYAPLDGNNSPENEYVSQFNLTLSGTTKFSGNPPVDLLENYL